MKDKLQLNLERPISFFPNLARALGGIEEAIFVQQLYYWSDKGNDEDGWIYKTKDEWEEETTIQRRKLDSIKRKLTTSGLLETKLERINGAPTLHYRLDIGKVRNVLMENPQTYETKSTKRTKHPYTETTTETTTKNCEETSQDKTSKKDISLSTDIAEILEAFKIVNPSYKKYYGNTTQRASAERMILEHGKKLILNTIGYLPKSNAQKYAPTITTAWQLEENLGKLKAWADKIKSNKPHVLI